MNSGMRFIHSFMKGCYSDQMLRGNMYMNMKTP